MEVDRRKQQLEKFVPTRATVAPLESTKLNKSVVITGPPGCGKTLTAYHVALELKEKGYDFLLVRDPNNMIYLENVWLTKLLTMVVKAKQTGLITFV